jgi:hypothetical protein
MVDAGVLRGDVRERAMADRSPANDTRPTTFVWRQQIEPYPRKYSRRSFAQQDVAARVARSMISRHGANAAREAARRLNRVIDCGDLAARDLWACVVHIIHERQNDVAANAVIDTDPLPLTVIAK